MITKHIMYRIFEEHGIAVVVDSKTDRLVVAQKNLFNLFKDWVEGKPMDFKKMNPFGFLNSPESTLTRTALDSHKQGMKDALSLFAAYHRIPLSGHLAVCKCCNLNCLHCFSLKNTDQLKTETILSLLDDLSKAGCLFLTITGGEPFMRNDLKTIVQHGFKRRFLIRIDSNATLIDAETAAWLSEFPNVRLHVSFYGSNPMIHDSMTLSEGSFLKTIRGIHHLKDRGVRVRLVGVITKLNFSDLEPMAALAESFNLPSGYTTDLFPRDDGSFDNTDIMVDGTQRRLFEAFMAKHDPAFLNRLNAEDSLCRAGLAFFAINERGDVRPCPKLRDSVIGNVSETPFPEIWCSDAARMMLEPVEKRLCRCAAPY